MRSSTAALAPLLALAVACSGKEEGGGGPSASSAGTEPTTVTTEPTCDAPTHSICDDEGALVRGVVLPPADGPLTGDLVVFLTHLDLGEERDNLRGMPHRCGVNGECTRFLELWNNVFIQYNLFEDGRLEPLPAKHVDTGMGFERIVSVLQGVDSNYKTDLFTGSLDVLRSLTGHSEKEMLDNFTPYRVICDHVRSAAFLIADGVVPGNAGRITMNSSGSSAAVIGAKSFTGS